MQAAPVPKATPWCEGKLCSSRLHGVRINTGVSHGQGCAPGQPLCENALAESTAGSTHQVPSGKRKDEKVLHSAPRKWKRKIKVQVNK